ncbi:MAG TPA: hypothetical protein PLF40_12745, partial [Kofleriaceae bacterium]|nr:hypothetical protein [Kofleriaceae bacterium]
FRRASGTPRGLNHPDFFRSNATARTPGNRGHGIRVIVEQTKFFDFFTTEVAISDRLRHLNYVGLFHRFHNNSFAPNFDG